MWVHLKAPRDRFETNSRHQKCCSEGGKKISWVMRSIGKSNNNVKTIERTNGFSRAVDLLLIQLHRRFVQYQEHMAGWTCHLDSLPRFLYYLYQKTKYMFSSDMLFQKQIPL